LFRLFGVVRRVAIQAPYIIARVRRSGEVPLLMLCSVATQATGVGVLLRHRRKADDFGNIPTAFYVRRSRTVTGFTSVSVVQRSFEMRGVLEVIFVELFMTGLAGVDPDILRGLGGSALFLRGGVGGPKHAQQQGRQRCQSQEL